MSDAAKKLLDEAMSLPTEERRELGLRLLLSVHDQLTTLERRGGPGCEQRRAAFTWAAMRSRTHRGALNR